MKKLLILGGSTSAINIVKKAKEMGYYTIVVDGYGSSFPAMKYSDEGYVIEVSKVDDIILLCKEKEIDGVITGYVDSYLRHYYQICKSLSLPCYTTPELISITTNKSCLKNACRKYNISVIPGIQSNHILSKLPDSLEYPVLIKPVDNQGSRGVSVCYNNAELIEACENALCFSYSGNILVEKYMKMPSVNMLYWIEEGAVYLEAIMDRRVNRTQKGCADLAEALLFPSKYLDLYQKTHNAIIIDFIKKCGFNNGPLFIQTFYGGKKLYLYEIGHRLPGTQTYKLVEKCCNYSPLEKLISFAMGEKSDFVSLNKINPNFNYKKCAIIICLLKKGKIREITGIESLTNIFGVIDVEQKHFIGDEIQLEGTFQQILARVFIVADTTDEMRKIISSVKRQLKVYDVDGNDQLLDLYNEEDLSTWDTVIGDELGG